MSKPVSKYEFGPIIDRAMIKFLKAKRSRVKNFTNPYSEMTLEASGNLGMEVDLCGWNKSTVEAIKYVLEEKSIYLSSK